MPEETVETVTLEQAIEEAVKGASAPSGDSAAELDGKGVDETGSASDEKATTAEKATAEVPSQRTAESEEPLLTEEQISKLDDAGRKAYKEMQRAWTQKTQSLSALRKQLEQHQDLIEDLRSNPKETLRRLAREQGMDLAEPQKPEPAEKPEKKLLEGLRERLGPDLEFIADALEPIIQDLQSTKQDLQSTKTQQSEIIMKTALDEAQSVLEDFGKDHPDWKDYEGEMTVLSHKLDPKGMTETEYLDLLYKVVTSGKEVTKQVGKETKNIVEKMRAAAKAAESPQAGVAESKIQSSPNKLLTVDEAFAEAVEEVTGKKHL